jgi:flagellar biosynthetic protein FlhB
MDGATRETGPRLVSKSDRTEKATPKKRDEARKRGQVARSQEVNVALSLLAAFGVLAALGAGLVATFSTIMASGLASAGDGPGLTPPDAFTRLMDAVWTILRVTAPFAITGALVGVLASALQVKPGITTEVLKPRFSVINPIKGFPRLFSLRSGVQLVRDVIKVTVIGAVAYVMVSSGMDEIGRLTGAGPGEILSVTAGLVLRIGFAVAAAYVVIAIADLLFQRWQFERDLRMTKDEVKREAKEADISPEVKGQLKRRQRDMATRRMMADVPQADVVITNPTHYAVALRYARALPAPRVVAKGADRVALRIREVATEHGIAIHEDPPLARSLYAAVEVGGYVPEDAFAAVAEVLAYVYRATGREPAAA